MELLLRCECCNKEKPKRNVRRNKATKKLICAACYRKEYNRKRPEAHRLAAKNWRLRHPEQQRLIIKNWRLRHPEQCKQLGREGKRRWRQQHPKERNKQRRRYYQSVLSDPRNTRQAHQEWTLTDMDLITAPDRPNDRQLSARIGRSIQAIQVMRWELKKKSSLCT